MIPLSRRVKGSQHRRPERAAQLLVKLRIRFETGHRISWPGLNEADVFALPGTDS